MISRVDRPGLLACLAAYGITDFMDADGMMSQKTKTRLYPEDVGSMFEMLPKWADQFHWKRLSQVEQVATDEEKDRLVAQEQMRTTTQMVRNWGFYDQVKRIGMEMLAPLDARFEAGHGYRPYRCRPIPGA